MGGGVEDWRSGRMYFASRSGSCRSSSAVERAAASESPWLRSSRYRSSRCSDNSSMISNSRAGARERPASLSRSAALHRGLDVLVGSGMFSSRNAGDGFDKELPRGALRGQHPPALSCQLVESASPLAGFFHPGAEHPPTLLEPVE